MIDLSQVHTFTEDGSVTFDVPDYGRPEFRTIAYSGSLGGGTLQVFAIIGPVEVPVPDSKLSIDTLDSQGEIVKSFPFRTTGDIKVVLSGSTAPNATVVVL